MPASGFVEASKSLDSTILILGTTKSNQFNKTDALDGYINQLMTKMDDRQMLLLGGDGNFTLSKFIKDPKFHFISTFQHLDSYIKDLN